MDRHWWMRVPRPCSRFVRWTATNDGDKKWHADLWIRLLLFFVHSFIFCWFVWSVDLLIYWCVGWPKESWQQRDMVTQDALAAPNFDAHVKVCVAETRLYRFHKWHDEKNVFFEYFLSIIWVDKRTIYCSPQWKLLSWLWVPERWRRSIALIKKLCQSLLHSRKMA